MKFIRSIKIGFKNIIKYFKVIWQDRDWDDYYIYKLLEVKFKSMYKFYSSDKAWSEDAPKVAEQIKEALRLLDKFMNYDYLHEALAEFYKKYPDYKWEIKTEPSSYGEGYRKIIDNDTPEQKILLRQCFKKEQELKEHDYDLFFDLLRNNIQSWWD